MPLLCIGLHTPYYLADPALTIDQEFHTHEHGREPILRKVWRIMWQLRILTNRRIDSSADVRS